MMRCPGEIKTVFWASFDPDSDPTLRRTPWLLARSMATGIVTPLSLDQLALQAAAVKKFTMAVGGMSLGIFVSSIRVSS